MLNVLSDFTSIIPATACHQRNYVETDSKYTGTPRSVTLLKFPVAAADKGVWCCSPACRSIRDRPMGTSV
jgi:hypothetical protein